MVKAGWERHGIAARPGASALEIEAFERLHGTRLSEDVADYFRAIDGMNEDDVDQFSIRFWSLGEMRSAQEEVPTTNIDALRDYFVFADYSLWAHGYAVRLGEMGDDVIVVGGERPVAVAPSFGAFLELYVSHPERLFPNNPRTP
jgi:hypothetical protein